MTQTFAILPAGTLWVLVPVLPTREGYAVLMSPGAPEAMLRAIKQIAPGS